MSSQNNQSRTQAAASTQITLSREDVTRKAAEVAQHFMIAEQKKAPVKRPDLVKNFGLQGKSFKVILEEANNVLKNVFGYEIYELKTKASSYILRNLTSASDVIKSSDLKKEHLLLFITLSAIYLNGGDIKEDDLWLLLDKLEFLEEEKKMITQDFEKQQYIAVNIVPQSDPPKRTFSWGERAEIEVDKLHIIEFASQIYKMEKEAFGKLYSELVEEQQSTNSQE